jgi:hypothetical protein
MKTKSLKVVKNKIIIYEVNSIFLCAINMMTEGKYFLTCSKRKLNREISLLVEQK